MAYDEALAERVDAQIGDREGMTDRKMFGGIAWMLNGNMAVGVMGSELIVRVADRDAALGEPHTRPFEMRGRAVKGFILVDPTGADLAAWVARGLAYAASLPPK